MPLLPALLLSLSLPARAGEVDLDTTTLRALLPDPPPAADPLPDSVERRDVAIAPVEGGWQVRASWQLTHRAAAERVWPLLPEGAHLGALRVDGAPGEAVTAVEGVSARVVGLGPHVVEVEAFVPEDAPLVLLPAAVGAVRVDDPEQIVADALELDGRFLTGRELLVLAPRPPDQPGARDTLALATVGLGLTVGEGSARVAARVVWTVRRGALEGPLRVAVPGAGADLYVDGTGLAAWRREGDAVLVELTGPVRDALTLDLSWTVPVGEAAVPVPTIRPDGAFRVDAALSVARDGEVELVPSLAGWERVSRRALPEWAEGLVEGELAGTWTAGRPTGGSVSLLRFEPLPGPPVLVDVADWQLATTDEGRVLLRGLLEVRNDRAGHLRVVPPPGHRILGARVDGETALPVTDDGHSWLIPLVRSVETVDGLLSFPIELTLLGEAAPWARREARAVPLPVLDAPVAVARTSVVLPPGWRSRVPVGERGVVEDFDRGDDLTYGFGYGDVGAAEADRLYREALDGWLANDFDKARDALSDLRGMGAESANIDRLESNLVVIVEGRDDGADAVAVRRVRRQAQARAVEQERQQAEYWALAEEAALSGDYDTSGLYLQQALDLGQTLAVLDEAEEVDLVNEDIALELEAVKRRKAELQVAADQSGRWTGNTVDATLPWAIDGEAELPWDVEGEAWFIESPVSGEALGMLTTRGYGAGGSASGYGSVGSVGYGMGGGGSAGRAFESVVIAGELAPAPDSDTRRSRGGRGGRGGRAAPPDLLDAPVVTAAALSVTVPALGELVRFQHLLLPASAEHAVLVDARGAEPVASRRSP